MPQTMEEQLRSVADLLEERKGLVFFPNFDFEKGPDNELPAYHSIRLACEQIRGDTSGEGVNMLAAHDLACLLRHIGSMIDLEDVEVRPED